MDDQISLHNEVAPLHFPPITLVFEQHKIYGMQKMHVWKVHFVKSALRPWGKKSRLQLLLRKCKCTFCARKNASCNFPKKVQVELFSRGEVALKVQKKVQRTATLGRAKCAKNVVDMEI